MRETPAPSEAAVDILGWAFLGGIIVTAIVGFIVAGFVEPSLDGEIGLLLTALFIITAFSATALARFVVLPSLASAEAKPLAGIASVGYAFAESPVIYGLVLAVMTADGWRIVPFALIAMVSWLLVRSYLNSLKRAAADAQFPSL